MKLEQLFHFLAVVKNGSINKAAHDLYISQSSLSRSIRLLEEEMGDDLLIRTSQGISLTPFGNEVYRVADIVCSNYTLIERFKVEKPSSAKLKMRISTHSLTFAEYAFTQLYKKYEDCDPLFALVHQPISQSIFDVKTGTSDLGISMVTSAAKESTAKIMLSSQLDYTPIVRLPMEAMLGINHPLANRKSISINDLMRYSFVSGAGNFEMSEMLSIFNRKKCTRNYARISDKAAMNRFLYETQTFSLIPSSIPCKVQLHRYDTQIVTSIPLVEKGLFFEIGWFKPQAKILLPICREYIDILTSMFDTIPSVECSCNS